MVKRRGDDVLVPGVTTVASEDPTSCTNTSALTNATGFVSASHISRAPEWLDSASFDHKLRVVRETLQLDSEEDNDDNFLREVSNCQAQLESFQRQQTQMLEKSGTIQQTLHTKIDDQQALCDQELSALSTMEDGILEIARERDSIQRDIADLNRLRETLEAKIALALEEANQEVENIDLVEEQRKNQVPRIKHQLSLYAQITGIKWDYSDDDVLKGEVSIPSKEVIRAFEVDPLDHTRFEVAQKLWGLLDAAQE